MALPSLSFLLGLLVTAYLGTFVIFAIVRIVTGISIQRVGLSSLRRIAYSPQDGIKIEIRGLGLKLHRPTFSQPTWISLVISEFKVTLDLGKLTTRQDSGSACSHDSTPNVKPELENAAPDNKKPGRGRSLSFTGSKTSRKKGIWEKLTDIKEKVKRLHRILSWLTLLDVVALKSSVAVEGIGAVHVSSLVLSVDTRRHAIDRSRLFLHARTSADDKRPVEWTILLRSLLFEPAGKKSVEIMDHCVVNVHGFLSQHVEGLRDAAVFIKLGRFHIPLDEALESLGQVRQIFARNKQATSSPIRQETERPQPLSPTKSEAETVQAFADAKGFVSSVLRGIREVSLAVSLLGVSKRIESIKPAGKPVYLSMSLKELGLDLFRLDRGSPAQAMYFAREDIAHQILLSAISLSVGVDDGMVHPERLLYVPMTTATVRTTLPSKLLQFASHDDKSDRNTNVFFANLVITSPSVDLDPRHLPLVLALVESRKRNPQASVHRHGQRFISRFLPRLNIKLSIQEPVVRVSLPSVEETTPTGFDFDLLVSAISSLSLDIESSHSTGGQYSAVADLRINAHKLFYQTASKKRHNLVINESIELKTQVTSTDEVVVNLTSNFKTFSLFMVRAEITKGIQQIMRQLRSDVQGDKLSGERPTAKQNPLRTLPMWLQHVRVDATDINFEIAGVDKRLSDHPRGFALHLESSSVEYNRRKDDAQVTPRKRRGGRKSISLGPDEEPDRAPSPLGVHRSSADSTDGRRVAVHIKGLEAFIIESSNMWEDEPFVSLPRAEVALTTSNDGHGQITHIQTLVKSVFIQYALFKGYCIAVAALMLQKTFNPARTAAPKVHETKLSTPITTGKTFLSPDQSQSTPEYVVVDAKVHFIQVKARLPSDPYMMLHLQEIEASRHRWLNPFGKAQIVRLYVESPVAPGTWSRVVSIKNPRLDIREVRRKHHGKSSGTTTEKSIDVASDAIRIGIPHQLVVHKIFDNIVNTVKAVEQLHHRFATDSDEYVLAKKPEGPKHVPKVSIRTHVLLFELEDGAFEWKLGVIYRAGLVEQKQRQAREEAFRLKSRRVQGLGGGQGPSKSEPKTSRAQRTASSSRSRKASVESDEDEHDDSSTTRASLDDGGPSDRKIRYDREGKCGFTRSTQHTVDEAWDKLQRYNSQSWKRRIDRAMKTQHGQITELRSLLWGTDSLPEDAAHGETILAIPQRPALMSLFMSDVSIALDKPSFPLNELPDFMNRVGKGLPKDTEFSLLVPLSAVFEIGETRMTLRDYPLPLLHIPALKPGQSARLPSWSLRTDFIVGEEFRDFESTRDFKIIVVPPEKLDPGSDRGGFAIDVRRTVSPVKTYSDINMEINSARDTRFTWGSSYQPAIQDMMQVIEGFTKPQIDPSDRVGFWDKIRLSFHSRVNVAWKGDGDVHLMLKGSRDPYIVTGYGAGLVMIWRNDVRWNIRQEEDPCKFMTVDSGDYVLAIPDFSHYARRSSEMASGQAQGQGSFSSSKDGAQLKKVIMKLSGKVLWQAGLVMERNLEGGGRSFEFKPHYDVTLKNPAHIKTIKGDPDYDAFRGFRSNHLHLSIAIAAPSDRDWSVTEQPPSTNYNSVHLSPRFFTHFFSWWSMFSGVMSLPIHQGPLYPGIEKSGKKFGRHIATIKYSLLLAPLFISHVYKHKEAEDYANTDDEVAATGLKLRLDSFMLDLHQRREEFDSEVKGLNKIVKTSGMKIYQTLLDLHSADIRAVSASITGTSMESVKHASSAQLAEYQAPTRAVGLSAFHIPDNDFSWIDVDDFVEVDWTLPENSDPKTKILPLAYAPRFTYRRQTDHHDTIAGDASRQSPFGYEPTHRCFMTDRSDSRLVQLGLLSSRLQTINNFIEEHQRVIGEQELHVVRETENKAKLESHLEELKMQQSILVAKKDYLARIHRELEELVRDQDLESAADVDSLRFGRAGHMVTESNDPSRADFSTNGDTLEGLLDPNTLGDHVSDFNNRFVVHNAHIKWTNDLRNIMLRYMHQVSQRRGFVYYTSRRAVKFILDIIEEQKTKGASISEPQADQQSVLETPFSPMDETEVADRIQQLLDDSKKFVDADDPEKGNGSRKKTAADKADEHVAHGLVVQNTYHVRLLAPQIQLQSLKNVKAAVLFTARGIRLKVFQVMDKDRVSDEVSGLVQRRFAAEMDNTQFFVTNKLSFSNEFLHMYSDSRYGASLVSSWPPWVPLEVMYDFEIVSFASHGFSRVVQKTSASLRYDKYNQLRLKYNDHVSDEDGQKSINTGGLENSMDHLWIDFPQLRALCDSSQYYAIYIIVLDLLMYSEPLEKTRNERLEKIMLAADFSDLRGAPEMVVMLQDRIRQLEEIKMHFKINERYLDRQGWQDRIEMERDLASCEDELFFLMKAITTSQRKPNDRREGSQVTGLLRWYLSAHEIVWHLTKSADEPLAEFQLGNALFERTDNSDGSNHNSVEIDKIRGLNLLQNAIYPEILTEYNPTSSSGGSSQKMLRVNWHMLEAIAGIPVVDTFEVNLFPLQMQLEHEIGKRLFEYIFPGKGSGEEGSSPFMVKHQPDQEEAEDMDKKTESAQHQQKLKTAASDPFFGSNAPGSATGAGSLELRLTPTHQLPAHKDGASPPSSSQSARRKSGLGINFGRGSAPRLGSTPTLAPTPILRPKSSAENVNSESGGARGRQTLKHLPASDDALASGPHSKLTTNGEHASDKRTRFAFNRTPRSSSNDSRVTRQTSNTSTGQKKNDDLTQMLSRASNYMTLAYVKIPSVVLCLSYKGTGSRNVADVHDLVFRMPTLEYRNKTWSNLDLALALKKDVIRALISHTGTIIGNKFSHHKPGKQAVSRLRELASSSVVLSSSQPDLGTTPTSSIRNLRASQESHRVSDVTEDYGSPSYAHSTAAKSYASSLQPTPESPEYADAKHSLDDDDDDIDRTNGDGPVPFHPAPDNANTADFRPPGTAHSSATSASGPANVRGTLSRHLSELAQMARNKRDSLAVPGSANGSAAVSRSASGDANAGMAREGVASRDGTPGVADEGADARSATTTTPKRAATLKKILKNVGSRASS